jgi:hypothetical protein
MEKQIIHICSNSSIIEKGGCEKWSISTPLFSQPHLGGRGTDPSRK